MRPGLTLLCITRDEAPKLMRLLESCKSIVDKMVVVDTGSKDLSVGVAKLAGARTYEIEWPGSFSDAMNFAISLVETEWTIRLDTDEWLRESSGRILREAMRDPGAVAYNLLREDVISEEVVSETYQLRMWRTDPRLKFEGFIHERVPPDLMREIIGDRKIYNLPARFCHDGYAGGISREKLLRNVALLRKELEARPGELYYEIDLTRSLLALGEQEGSERLATLVDALTQPGAPTDPWVADLFIAALERGVEPDRRSRVVETALSSFRSHPPLMWAVALSERQAGRVSQSREVLVELMAMFEDPENLRKHGVQQNARAAIEGALAELSRLS